MPGEPAIQRGHARSTDIHREVSHMIKTWGPHNRRRIYPPPGWPTRSASPPPPWAGGLVVNHALLAEAEAREGAEQERRRKEEEEAAAEAKREAQFNLPAPFQLPRAVDYLRPPEPEPDPVPEPVARPRLTRRQLRLIRHSARCRVCRHPRRDEIDRALIDWTSPRDVTQIFRLGSERAVYRHARIFGLLDKRRSNHQTALGFVIEQVRHVKATASSIVSAIRLSREIERDSADD